MRRGLEAVNHFSGLGLGQLPHANYPVSHGKFGVDTKKLLLSPAAPLHCLWQHPPPSPANYTKGPAQWCTSEWARPSLATSHQTDGNSCPTLVANLLSSISQS